MSAYAFILPGHAPDHGPRGGHCRRMSRHGRGGSHPFGHSGWGGAFGAGPGGPWQRKRMRRGDVRAAILVLLAEEPNNGYGLMQAVEDRSDGVWRPSPGSMYPALAQLEDEGLIAAEQGEGSKRFTLTDAGRAYVEEHAERLGEPWAGLDAEGGSERRDIRGHIGQLAAAAVQVAQAGTDEQVDQARQVLVDARKALYRLLADDKTDA